MGRSRSRSRTPPRRHKRSRSRSPSRRDKDRSSRRQRSRSRDRDRRGSRDRRVERDRRRDVPDRSKRGRRTSDSLSPEDRRDRHRDRERRRDRSRSRSRSDDRKAPKVEPEVIEINDEDLEGKTDDEVAMMKAMGFCGFNTTKGNKVDGNDVGAVHHVVQRKYRQYMNRKGGFNRPLDYVN